MIKFRQHVPGSVDADPFHIEVEGTKELLTHPKIASYIGDVYGTKFSKSKGEYDRSTTLMISSEDGMEWWVVGYSDKDLDLPIWTPNPIALKELDERQSKYSKEPPSGAWTDACKDELDKGFKAMSEELKKERN